MTGKIDAPAKWELRSVIQFLQVEGRVVHIHDNAHPHSVVVMQKLLEKFETEVCDHTAYIPDLATSDFHIFPELKIWLGGQSLQKIEEIQSKLKTHLTTQVATFFEGEDQKLVHRYIK
ncbi:hypothetical protein AVEN_272860-1 [Araneus ventricosus]|uniref:Histone-lysine N-methyltransferase SETMAR n=1 Tax=Araneus ventricosus TaxID=182803 RepID=A0A4Y2RWU9_ARAVE|nr:hypothetical protein AVEN_272860-1 [Araneus ventricosus]